MSRSLAHLVASSNSRIFGFCGERTQLLLHIKKKIRNIKRKTETSMCYCTHLEQSSGYGYPLLLTT